MLKYHSGPSLELEESVSGANEISTHTVSFIINGVSTQLKVLPWVSLLDALREYLNLTGTKKGCDHGQCGHVRFL